MIGSKGVVYGLQNAEGKVFYVGQTIYPSARLREHIKTKTQTVCMTILEPELWQGRDLDAAERRWIRFYGRENLVNKTSGGQGDRGFSQRKSAESDSPEAPGAEWKKEWAVIKEALRAYESLNAHEQKEKELVKARLTLPVKHLGRTLAGDEMFATFWKGLPDNSESDAGWERFFDKIPAERRAAIDLMVKAERSAA